MQPSFLRFYLFRITQHNTSFLLTFEGEIKYPGGSFSKQPKFFTLPIGLSFFSFSTVKENTLFICWFGQPYFSLKHNSKPCPSIFLCIPQDTSGFCIHTRHVRILHTYSLISHPLFQNILFNIKIRPLIKPPNSRPHSKGTFTTRSGHKPVPQIEFQSHSRANSQNAGLATNPCLKFLDPSLKTCYSFN